VKLGLLLFATLPLFGADFVHRTSREPLTISYRRLGHEVPREARRAFDKAVPCMKANNVECAVRYLQEVVRLDPGLYEGHLNLAAQYLKLRQPEAALAHAERALAIDPGSADAMSNLSSARLQMKDFAGAEEAARLALRQDPRSVLARFLLGMARVKQGCAAAESIALLEQSKDVFPVARLVVAEAHLNSGAVDSAREEVSAYLASGDTRYRAYAKTWLNRYAAKR
jgi:tetratricopeptide (TPR) repeat protein